LNSNLSILDNNIPLRFYEGVNFEMFTCAKRIIRFAHLSGDIGRLFFLERNEVLPLNLLNIKYICL